MKREPKIVTCANIGCNETHMQFDSLRTWCSSKCGYELSQYKLKQKEYMEAINGTPKTKPNDSLSHQRELTQEVFNLWVRKVKEKDADCCISCRRPRGAFTEHAGHFVSVGHSNYLRFEPDNCHLQCKRCNKDLSSNSVQYRIHLIEKLGLERVEKLEFDGHNGIAKFKVGELKDWRAQWAKEIRQAA